MVLLWMKKSNTFANLSTFRPSNGKRFQNQFSTLHLLVAEDAFSTLKYPSFRGGSRRKYSSDSGQT